MGTIIIKNKTVGGDLCHQIFEIQEYKGEKVLIICKKIFTKNIDRYGSDFKCLKVKNGYRLYMKNFSIRLSTLELVLNKLKMEHENLNEPQNLALSKGDVRRNVTITFPLDIAETLQALIDGSIGTSDNDDFNEQMAIVLKKLDKAVSKHYA